MNELPILKPVIDWINMLYPKSVLTLLFVIGPLFLCVLTATVRLVLWRSLPKQQAQGGIFVLAAMLVLVSHVKYNLGNLEQIVAGLFATLLIGWLALATYGQVHDFLAERTMRNGHTTPEV